jgi:uncharacterized tellurite resistance protein B-like protein
MTPAEKRVLKSLVAVAWADGKVDGPESGVLEGLLAGFGASDEEETEILDWAKTARSLDDVPLAELNTEDRELLLANAALLTEADGEQSESEKEILQKLITLLGFTAEQAKPILESARDGALQLGTKPLEEIKGPPKPPPSMRK